MTSDTTTLCCITIHNGKSGHNRRRRLAAVEVKSSMRLYKTAVTVDYCRRDNARVCRVGAADGNRLAIEIDIPVAGAGVCTRRNDYDVAVVTIIDSRLDC
jgi:hypothetical protein